MVYIKAKDADKVAELESRLAAKLTEKYPEASDEFKQATNIFNLIFSENEPPLIAMVKGKDGSVPIPDELNNILQQIKNKLPEVYIEPIQWQEQILLVADQQMMALYGVDYNSLYALLSRATKESKVFSINSGSFSTPVIIGDNDVEQNNLLSLNIANKEGVDVPLSLLLKERKIRDLKSVISGKDGDYYPLEITANDKDIPKIERTISHLAQESDSFNVTFAGAYYSGRAMIKELMLVLLISILLLFFILAAQFESLLQPLIILSEVIVDLFGALFLLWACGAGLNLMSLIGIVVMCGIIINDSILKVDTINKLIKEEGYPLLKAIMEAGVRRLKPILMTSLTTILAIAPFLIKGNLGADLQFPLSVALIGGMVLGTLVSIFFIPLFYYEIYRRRYK